MLGVLCLQGELQGATVESTMLGCRVRGLQRAKCLVYFYSKTPGHVLSRGHQGAAEGGSVESTEQKNDVGKNDPP